MKRSTVMGDLEDETQDHARARLLMRARRMAIELAISAVFLASFFAAERAAQGGEVATPAAIAFLAMSIGALVLWLVVYIRWHLRHDEFERLLELRAVAIAAGVMIVAMTGWGLAELIFRVPALPVVFAAPVFTLAYGVVRLLISRAYR